MGRLRVEGVELRRLAGLLETAGDRAKDASRALQDHAWHDLGDADLVDACHDFAHDWGYGLDRLGDVTRTLGRQLEEGVRGYEDADRQLAAVLPA